MKKGFLKHFAVIGMGTFLNLILGVLTTPIITRIVDPSEYGQLSIFNMYSNIGLMVLCLGLDQALVRYFYESDTIQYKRALLFRCLKLPIIASCSISVVIIILSLTGLVEFEFNSVIVCWLCIFTIIQLIYRFSLLMVRLSYKSKLYSSLQVLHKIAYILIALPLLTFVARDYLLLMVLATVLSVLICMVWSIIAQADEWNIFKIDRASCNISLKELIKYGYPYIISMGVTTLFQAIDKISLNMYCSYSEVGIYSSTMSLVNVFAIIQTTFNTLWAPMAVEHYSKDKDDRAFYYNGNQYITIIMYFLGVSLILCKDVFSILLGAKYREAAYILPFLIFNPIMYTISETTVNGLVFMKKSKMQVVVAVGACITNIIGNTILVPKLGCQGAAISTGLSYIVFFTLRTILSNRYFYIDFKLKKFYLLTLIVSIYAMYNTFVHFNIGSVVGYVVCVISIVVLYKDHVHSGLQYLKNMAAPALNTITNRLKK